MKQRLEAREAERVAKMMDMVPPWEPGPQWPKCRTALTRCHQMAVPFPAPMTPMRREAGTLGPACASAPEAQRAKGSRKQRQCFRSSVLIQGALHMCKGSEAPAVTWPSAVWTLEHTGSVRWVWQACDFEKPATTRAFLALALANRKVHDSLNQHEVFLH